MFQQAERGMVSVPMLDGTGPRAHIERAAAHIVLQEWPHVLNPHEIKANTGS